MVYVLDNKGKCTSYRGLCLPKFEKLVLLSSFPIYVLSKEDSFTLDAGMESNRKNILE